MAAQAQKRAGSILIYAFICRKTRSCYIGQTGGLAERAVAHLRQAHKVSTPKKTDARDIKNRWLTEAARTGVELRILCYCQSRKEAEKKELEFIYRADCKGWRVLNQSLYTRVT